MIRRGAGVEIVTGYLRDDGAFLPVCSGQLDSEVWAFLRHEFKDETVIRPEVIRRLDDTATMVNGTIQFRDYNTKEPI
jgi:hypothetical protein